MEILLVSLRRWPQFGLLLLLNCIMNACGEQECYFVNAGRYGCYFLDRY
jgi:hypothetical protein